MKRPSRWFVPYEDQALFEKALARVNKEYPGAEEPRDLIDPVDYWRDRDFDDLEAARVFAKENGSDVYERYGFEDVTPRGDPPGLLWVWEERLVLPEVAR